MSVAFDTLKAARRLSAAGFTDEQAETLAGTFAEGITENLATKDDIALVRKDIETQSADMEAKIERAKFDLTWRLLGGVALINGLMFAFIRYFPGN